MRFRRDDFRQPFFRLLSTRETDPFAGPVYFNDGAHLRGHFALVTGTESAIGDRCRDCSR